MIHYEYYETIDQQEFKIFKNSKLLILKSPFQAKINLKYKDNIYADGTFYAATKISYQLFITRIYAKDIYMIITTFPFY